MSSDMERRFVAIGAGGVGGHLLRGLARTLCYNFPDCSILIVDGDRYEPHNIERQEFSTLGFKAEVKAMELQQEFPNIFIGAESRWVVESVRNGKEEGSISAENLLRENDVVLLMVDNFATRKVVFDAARSFDNISVFTAGNDDKLFVSTYHYQRKDGSDVTDHPAVMHKELEFPPDKNPGDLSCEEKAKLEGGTQTIAANMAAAALLLGRISFIIFDNEEDTASEIMMDLGHGRAAPKDQRVIAQTEEALVLQEI